MCNTAQPQNGVINERSQAQKTKVCMIPFIGNFQKRQNSKDRKRISSCLGLGGQDGD